MYRWMKDFVDLQSNSQFQLNPTQGYLRITMVTEDSEGIYVCTARNNEGTEIASVPYALQIQPIERKEIN